MWKQLKAHLKEQWTFFTVILIFLSLLAFFLNEFSRKGGHIILNRIHSEFLDALAPYITYIGDGITAIAIILLLFLWKERYGLLALIAFLFTAGVTHGLKYFVFDDVERPFLAMWNYFHEEGGHLVYTAEEMKVGNSFPSGHTTSAMSIFCLLALLIRKKTLGFVFALMAILAATSRIYLSQHFVEDVFWGTIIGAGGTLLMVSLLDEKFKSRFGDSRITLKRTFDYLFSIIVLVIGLPFFLLISVLIKVSSKGSIFFKQQRVGKDNQDFGLLKFRTMKPDSEKLGQITVGGKDPRITKIGYFLRKYKLDEFPQLINVLKGEMSIIGPRPEVRKYVSLYNEEQMRVLSVKPGLSDFASLEYIDENELLGKSDDPEKTYQELIMPSKLALNLKYIDEQSFALDLRLVLKTMLKIVR